LFLWWGDDPSVLLQYSCSILLEIAHRRSELKPAPFFSAGCQSFLPARMGIKPAFADEELEKVFQRGPEAFTAGREVECGYLVRILDSAECMCPREEMTEGTSLREEVPM